MYSKSLPPLQKLIFPAFATIFRSKRIGAEDINLQRRYRLEQPDQAQLRRYIEYFDFPFPDVIPLSYLYLIAQPAQVALMLDRKFPLPLPGMIHLNNYLSWQGELNPEAPLDLQVSAHIEAKAEGSLFPVLSVEFRQGEQPVAVCRSGYFVRRKRKGKKTQRKPKEIPFPGASRINWEVPASAAAEYAGLSGDINPVHLSWLFARLAGFPRKFIHGWYSLSRALAGMERESSRPFRQLEVHFSKPLLLPGRAELGYAPADGGACAFALRDDISGRILMHGNCATG